MTSHDVRDMLDLPSSSSAPRPKKAKTTVPKPKLGGLAREVQNLGGDNPIAIVPEEAVFKKKRFGSRKPAAKWEARPFKNSARGGDGLILKHWRKVEGKDKGRERTTDGEGDTEMGENGEERKEEEMIEDSTFAKYNVKVQVPTYTDEEYKEILEKEGWSRHETDYLVGLVQEYDLRWPVIWDRYEYVPPDIPETAPERAMIKRPEVRTMEDLKSRYYTIGAAMMALRKPLDQMNTAEFDLHQKMLNYQPRQEKHRKDFLEGVFTRTREEAREEESLMVELKRILARSEKFMEERRELYARLDAPASSSNISPYTTSQGLHQLFQQLVAADKSKKRKPIQEGQTPGGSTPVGANTPSAYDGRRDSSIRESISGPSGNAGNSSAVGHKKGSLSISAQNPSERRRLTEEEEKVYGVSHHDRLQGGPYFRGEKLVRPLTTKSTIQQTRMKNTLAELGIGEKATMATVDVAHGYDELFRSIGIFLDSRKVVDKLTGEIAVLREQLDEKKRRKAGADGGGSSTIGGVDGSVDERQKEGGNENGNESKDNEGGNEGARDAEVVPTTEKGDGKSENGTEKEKEGGDGDGDGDREGNGDDNINVDADANAAVAHKRSASVLSTGTDKSSKRQKK